MNVFLNSKLLTVMFLMGSNNPDKNKSSIALSSKNLPEHLDVSNKEDKPKSYNPKPVFFKGTNFFADIFKDKNENVDNRPLARRMTSEIVSEVIDTIKAKTAGHNHHHQHDKDTPPHLVVKPKPKVPDESVVRKMTREMVSEAVVTLKEKVGINPRSITAAVATMAFANAAMNGAVIATKTKNFVPFVGALVGTYISSEVTKFLAKESKKKTHTQKLEEQQKSSEKEISK